MILQELVDKQLIKPPDWMPSNCHYLTIMGSVAYGVSSDTSDMDLYGFAIPKKDVVFPHLAGYIPGFGDQPEMFAQWQKHGVVDEHALAGKGRTYDFTIFNIVKFFDLLINNNPNIIDSIYTPQECVLHMTHVGNLVREHKDIFLHKGCYPKFKGYAYSQLHKMTCKEPIGKRKKIREEFGFDCKFAYHLVRLLNECEQILMNGTLDLRLNNEQLKAIRRGEVEEADIRKWASDKEKQLEELFVKSELPTKPRKDEIKKLLLECLDYHYGTLDKCIILPDRYKTTLQEVKSLIDKAGI
jgi:predicted nucleotidyltransferase